VTKDHKVVHECLVHWTAFGKRWLVGCLQLAACVVVSYGMLQYGAAVSQCLWTGSCDVRGCIGICFRLFPTTFCSPLRGVLA
jgi:hypothetical protein